MGAWQRAQAAEPTYDAADGVRAAVVACADTRSRGAKSVATVSADHVTNPFRNQVIGLSPFVFPVDRPPP